MRISTKRGDDGSTQVLGLGRVSKSHEMIEYLGTVDELQSILGVLPPSEEIERIQTELYTLMCGDIVSCHWMDTDIPKQTEFILPKGMWHVARTVCRRAERRAVEAGVNCIYLNRLSDLLYKKALNE